MKIIALVNQKGGVAKTTSTYNLAIAKAMKGKNVLMIDLDPQASLTISCDIMPGEKEWNSCHLFNGKNDPLDCAYKLPKVALDNIYIVPSDIDLAETDMGLITRTSREKLLKRSLKKYEEYFDYIFIDCPPQLGLLTTNALVAADEIIIPTKAEYLAYRGLKALYKSIENVKNDEDLNPNIIVKGIIITMFEKNVNDQKDIYELYSQSENILGVVKKSVDAYRSNVDGTPVVISNVKSEVSKSYIEIADEI